MPNLKTTELGEQVSYDVDTDLVMTVDVSDTSMAASGTNKKILGSNLSVYATKSIYDNTDSGLTTDVQTSIDQLNEIVSQIGRTAQGSWLVSGGGVVWVVDYDFDVAAATYYIFGKLYSSPLTRVTLGAADATNPRFDAIVAQTDGTVVVIAGAASPNPETPSFDPSTQIVLAYVRVDALTTSPDNLTTEIIYRENIEWTTASNSANIVANDATDPYAGTLVVRATSAVAGNAITFTDSATFLRTSFDYLSFYIKFATWPNSKSLAISWLNGANAAGGRVAVSPGNYGIVSGVAGYQLCVIPLADFTGLVEADVLRIAIAGGGPALSFAIDNIELSKFDDVPNPIAAFIETINGIPDAEQFLVAGTAGTDFAIVSDAATHTLNLPDASASNRGVVTTGTQSLEGAKTFRKTVQVLETTTTPAGTTQTIDLGLSNHQTLDLTSTTGATAATFTAPPGSSAGTVIIKQHATPRALTWAVTGGTIKKSTEPAWASAATLQMYVMSWRWDGSVLYLSAVEVV